MTPSKKSIERTTSLSITPCVCEYLDSHEKPCSFCKVALAFDRLVEEACEVASAQFSEHRRSEAKHIRHGNCRGCELVNAIRLKLKGGEE